MIIIALIVLAVVLCRRKRQQEQTEKAVVSKPIIPPKPKLMDTSSLVFGQTSYSQISDYNVPYERQFSENSDNVMDPHYGSTKVNPMYTDDEHRISALYENEAAVIPQPEDEGQMSEEDEVSYDQHPSDTAVRNSYQNVENDVSNSYQNVAFAGTDTLTSGNSVYRKNDQASDNRYANHLISKYSKRKGATGPAEVSAHDGSIGLDNESISGIHPTHYSLPNKDPVMGEDYPKYENNETIRKGAGLSEMVQQSYVQYQNSIARPGHVDLEY